MTQHLQRSIYGLLIACFCVVPIIFWMDHFSPFVTMKEFVFTVAVVVSSALWVVAAILKRTWPVRWDRLTLAVMSYYAYNLLSLLLFPYTDALHFFLFTWHIVLFLLVSNLFTIQVRNRLFYGLFIVALTSSIYGCLQFFGIDFSRSFWNYFGQVQIGDSEGMRIFTFFGHPNLLGGFCVAVLPLLLIFLIRSGYQKRYVVSLGLTGVLGLTGISLFLSRTRGSWLAACAACGILIVSVAGLSCQKFVRRHRLSAILVGVVALALFATGLTLASKYTSLTDSTSLRIRWEYYQRTLAMIRERPVFGHGFGTFKVYYLLYRDNRIATKLGEPANSYRVEHPHNEHLEILHDGGLIGYGLFLWVIVEAIILLLKKNENDIVNMGILATIFGLLCDGLLSQNLRFVVISSLFWLLLGCANIREFEQKRAPSSSGFRWQTLHVIGMILVVIGASGLVRKAYRIMQADAYVRQGMAYYSHKHFQPAISRFSNALSRNPRNTRALYYQASAHRLLQHPDRAVATYLRLLALDPYFLQANYHLGGIYAQQRDLEHAKTCFETQIAVDNMHWKSYYNLALLELHQSHNDQAILYLEEIEHIHSIQQVDEQIVQRARELLTRLRPETASTL